MDFNLDKIIEQTIRKCVSQNLDKTNIEIAELLGVSDRNLFRWYVKFKIQKPRVKKYHRKQKLDLYER